MQRILLAVALLALVGLGSSSAATTSPRQTNIPKTSRSTLARAKRINPAIHKIRHVVVIMQENRSFDSYFGTYPRADGIPMQNGIPTLCVPDPASGRCVPPFHDPNDV